MIKKFLTLIAIATTAYSVVYLQGTYDSNLGTTSQIHMGITNEDTIGTIKINDQTLGLIDEAYQPLLDAMMIINWNFNGQTQNYEGAANIIADNQNTIAITDKTTTDLTNTMNDLENNQTWSNLMNQLQNHSNNNLLLRQINYALPYMTQACTYLQSTGQYSTDQIEKLTTEIITAHNLNLTSAQIKAIKLYIKTLLKKHASNQDANSSN